MNFRPWNLFFLEGDESLIFLTGSPVNLPRSLLSYYENAFLGRQWILVYFARLFAGEAVNVKPKGVKSSEAKSGRKMQLNCRAFADT